MNLELNLNYSVTIKPLYTEQRYNLHFLRYFSEIVQLFKQSTADLITLRISKAHTTFRRAEVT